MVFAQYIATYFGNKHQVVYALHTNTIVCDKRSSHIHFIINPVSFVTGEYLNIKATHFNNMFNIIRQLLGNNYRNLELCKYDDYYRK